MLQNYFSHSSCCFLLLFYPPVSNLPETAGCLKSQYHREHFTVLRHCHYGLQLTNRKHHTPYGKISSILHLQWKTKLKQYGAQLQLLLKTVFCWSFLAKMLYTTRTCDSVIYSILCYFLHFRLEYSPQHLSAIQYFPMGEKQICPHAESKIRILWTSIFRLLVS